MKYKNIIVFLIIILAVLSGCKKEKDKYFFGDTEEYVDSDLLSLLKQNKDYSTFVSLIERYQLDTIFNSGKSITIFVPTNEAFATMGEMYLDTVDVLKYHISEAYINIAHIQGERQIQTYGKKYANIHFAGGSAYMDNEEITLAGPLCKNGKYYELTQVVIPKPNLYEFISATNPFYKAYIDLLDSSRLDPFSTPIGYTENGQTIYDTLWIEENFFEINYFPVSEELKDKKATMLLFTGDQLNVSLQDISEKLSLSSIDQIPEQWKNDVMMPYLINQSVFRSELGVSDFSLGRVNNIQGDSVDVNADNIDPMAFVCSNGLAYNYINFDIPETLYSSSDTIHGSDMVIYKGTGDYAWAVPDVTADAVGVDPVLQFNQNLGKDVLNINLIDINDFSVTLKFDNLFPGTYRFLCNVKSNPSGVFKVLVNGEAQNIKMTKNMITTNSDVIDLYDLRDVNNNRIKYFSGTWYSSYEGFRVFEVLVENITEFGEAEVTLEYMGPSPENTGQEGMILDYLVLEGWLDK